MLRNARVWVIAAVVLTVGTAGCSSRPAPRPAAAAPTTTAPPAPPLSKGATGADVQAVQQRLADLGYDPGAVDGTFTDATEAALYAFQKAQGLEVNGQVGDAERKALKAPAPPPALRPDGGADRVEIDLTRQLLVAYQGGNPILISHVASGNGEHFCIEGHCRDATTPTGDFHFQRFAPGWVDDGLGGMYNSMYFTRTDGVFDVAVHGSNNVPLHPASHGCVRMPMHVAEKFPNLAHVGEPIFVVAT